MNKKTPANNIAQNKKARFEYHIEETFEAGLILEGWEVKSLRAGKTQLTDSYITIRKNEAWWIGGHILPLTSASTHVKADPQRTRKLLLNRKELNKLIGLIERQGYTLIPINLHWKQSRAKMDIGLAKGKKLHDKRSAIKERDWARDKQRLLKQNRT